VKILIIGSGGREHALAWRIKQSDHCQKLWTANGNAGTAQITTNIEIDPQDIPSIVTWAKSESVDLVVVGPEVPLADGIVDKLSGIGIPTFGPTKYAAQIESSKAFARDIMASAKVPSPGYKTFNDIHAALNFVTQNSTPLVIKADGLASGKGVVMCETRDEASKAVLSAMSDRVFGASGDTIVIEEFLTGQEVSVFVFCDGESISSPIAACDYKQIGDGNIGPNTGGMGSYTHPHFWSSSLESKIMSEIMFPTIEVLSAKGIPYKGILYAGIMLTDSGPKVLEFNCRFGDPETQVILPLLESDPIEIMMSCIEGSLNSLNVKWGTKPHVGVVMTSKGYPGIYETGLPITGLDEELENTYVFHSGTATDDNHDMITTSGGRVLTVVGWGDSLSEAKTSAYARVDTLKFKGANWRTDIGE